jgi:hypothetical protein
MKFPSLFAALVAGFIAFSSTGCAVFTKGKKQMVVVYSTPAGASAKINGTAVGQTPFKVKLKRDEVFRLDFEKPGFAPESALLLPSSTEYNERYLRWGIDYDLGVASDLVPAELNVELKPALAPVTSADRYAEMSAQILRADAMLASGELTAADHKYLVEKIIATYNTSR